MCQQVLYATVMTWCFVDISMTEGNYVGREANLSNIASATVASKSANWSPTHFRAPPPNGMKAKSAATSLGYREEP